MAGTVRGKIECFSSPASGTPYIHVCQELFKNLYDFMVTLESADVVTIRARYDGIGATAPATNYWDLASPFLPGAWFLVEWRTSSTTPSNPSYAGTRTYPFYMLFQYVSQAATQTNPSGPIFIRGANTSSNTAAVAVAMAVGYGGTQDPWTGTLGTFGNPSSFGTQSKSTPVWAIPSGGTEVHVFPRSNNTVGPVLGAGVGAHTTDKQNMTEMLYIGNASPSNRYHFLADHDGLLTLADYSNNNLYNMSYSGVYTPRPSLPLTTNLVQFQGVLPYTTSPYGTVAGTGLTNGGILTSDGVQGVALSRLDELYAVAYQPNRMFASPTHDEFAPTIGSSETNRGAFLGYIDLFREVFNTGNGDTNTGGTRAIFGGSATAGTTKVIVPWNAGTVPFSGLTRAGVSF